MRLLIFIFLTLFTFSFGQVPPLPPRPPQPLPASLSPAPASTPAPAPSPSLTPSLNVTGPAPAPMPAPSMNGTMPAPAPMNGTTNGTMPAPAPMNGTMPAPAPANGTMNGTMPAPAPMNGTMPAPAPMNSTMPAPAPANGTMNGTGPQPAPQPPAIPPALPIIPPVTSFIFNPFHPPDTGGPMGRSNAVMGIASDDRTVVILGGNNRGHAAEGNWKFDMVTQKWHPFDLPTGNLTRISSCTHQSLDMDTMWIYGGYDQHGQTRNLMLFHIHDNSVKYYPDAPITAGSKDVACAVMNNNKDFAIFGGSFGTPETCSNELYLFQASSNSWINLLPPNATAVRPPPRRGAVAVNFNDQYFVIYGGGCGNMTYNDTWRFNIATSHWSQDVVTGTAPSARSWAASEIDGDHMYVIGGTAANGSTVQDLVYVYDLDDMVWLYLTFQQIPAPRSNLAVAKSLNRVVIFGGSNNLREYNDIWQFVIEQNCFVLDCITCVRTHGCGYCLTNDYQFGCIAATPQQSPYIPATCLSAVQFDDMHCPAQVFPAWAIGLIVVLVLLIFGFLVFCAVRLKTRTSFEQVK